MVNYKNGKIYKLVNDELGLTYYGSTCTELKKRFYAHKSKAKAKKCTSYKLFEKGECKIYLVEKCPCDNKNHLESVERFYIENNLCVNTRIPFGRWYGSDANNDDVFIDNWIKPMIRRINKQHYEENRIGRFYNKKQYYNDNKKIIKKFYLDKFDELNKKI